MILTNNVNSITFTLSDILVLTGIVCLIILTIYVVLTLKSLIALFNKSTEFVDESSKVVEDIQAKSKAVDEFVQEIKSSGHVLFKFLSMFKR